MTILLFSEEYRKTTTGMFSVWSAWTKHAPAHHSITVLVNREHWITDEPLTRREFDRRINFRMLPFRVLEHLITSLRWFQLKNPAVKIFRKLVYSAILTISVPCYSLMLISFLRRFKAEVLIVHNGGWPGGKLCHLILLAGWILGIKRRILVVHGHPLVSNSIIGRLRLKLWKLQGILASVTASRVIAVSDALCGSLSRYVLPGTVAPIRIYNGIESTTGDSQSKNRSTRRREFRFGFIGSLHPLKDPEVLIQAFLQMKKRHCVLSLLGPGNTEYVRHLQDLAAHSRGKEIMFLGFSNDVTGYLQSIDALVVPSRFETFGMVILEAMRQKKPVICSDSGGMKEIVLHGKTGFVFQTGSASDLAGYMDRLAGNRSLGTRLAAAGYKRFRKNFTAEKMVAEYERVLAA